MKLIKISIMIMLSFNFALANSYYNDLKEKQINQNQNIEFNFGKNDLDYGCISIMANVKNKQSKKLKALYYSVIHEIWRNNPTFKNIEEPTLNNISNQIKSLCNRAMSKNKKIEFLIYNDAIKYKMSAERFFDIEKAINKYNF